MSRGWISNLLFSGVSWLTSIAFLLVLILAARFLGDEAFGRFSFAFSLVALFEITADLGIKPYLVREVARSRDQTAALLGSALLLKVALTAGTIALLFFASLWVTSNPEVHLTIAILAVAMISKSFKFLWRGLLTAHGMFQREALVVALDRALLLLASALCFIWFNTLLAFAVANCTSSVIGLLLTYLLTDRQIRSPAWTADAQTLYRFLRGALPFGLSIAAFLIYMRLDTIMLSLLRNDQEVGWYNAAYRLVEGLIIIPMILQYVLFPRLSVLHLQSRDAVEDVLLRACKYLVAAGLMIGPLGILLAHDVVDVVYGSTYEPATVTLRILLAGVPFVFLYTTLFEALNAMNRPYVPLAAGFTGAAVDIGLNFYFIPRYGHVGASVSTVAVQVFLCLFSLAFLYSRGYKLAFFRSALKPLTALAAAILISVLLSAQNVVVVAVVASLAYCTVLYALRFVDAYERSAVAGFAKGIVSIGKD